MQLNTPDRHIIHSEASWQGARWYPSGAPRWREIHVRASGHVNGALVWCSIELHQVTIETPKEGSIHYLMAGLWCHHGAVPAQNVKRVDATFSELKICTCSSRKLLMRNVILDNVLKKAYMLFHMTGPCLRLLTTRCGEPVKTRDCLLRKELSKRFRLCWFKTSVKRYITGLVFSKPLFRE